MKLREEVALAALQGMLAHATRYKPRKEDQFLHWHDAIVKEAFEIADSFIEESKREKE